MAIIFEIRTQKELDIHQFMRFLDILDLEVEDEVFEDDTMMYLLFRPQKSTTAFSIEPVQEGYELSFDPLSSYDDYKLLPYIIDSLCKWLDGKPYQIISDDDDEEDNIEDLSQLNLYRYFNEEWMQTQIGDAIAFAKCVMSLHMPYYMEVPIHDISYITESVLNEYGVSLYSSTPRIYGYIQYLLRNNKLPDGTDLTGPINDLGGREYEVDVPQHVSIGTVKSWQTDGSETTESFCAQDVALLINIGQRFLAGAKVDGVVLNDIGTIYQEGIGVKKDVDKALEWYRDAVENGDRTYAPSNIGDIYRKGLSWDGVNLKRALNAYLLGDDPYAWYRVGQAYEEGWADEPNMEKAMLWYKKAAKSRHHLALKRLEQKP